MEKGWNGVSSSRRTDLHDIYANAHWVTAMAIAARVRLASRCRPPMWSTCPSRAPHPLQPLSFMQPQLVVESEGYRGGQTALALSQAFLAVDDLLVLPEHREELKALRGGDKEEKQKT